MNRSYLIPAVLGLASLFAIASLTEAAPRGGGGPGRGGAYYGGRGYGYGGGYYHNGYWYGPGIGIGIGIGAYPYYGYGYPYAYPPVVVAGAPPTVIVQGQPAVDGAPPSPADAPKNAQIKVLLSDPSAKVWFDGNATTSTGT